MDFSKFKPSDWLKAGGGLVMLIAFFLPWWSIDGAGLSSLGSTSGSDYFFTGTLPWLLLVAIGVLTVLAAGGIFKLPSTLPAPLIFLAAAALSFLLLLIRFFSDGFDSYAGISIPTTRGIGLYLAFLASIAILVGSFMGFKESGGDLNDLKNMNKLKGQFSGGPAGGPPPPPPGMQPPPPPPPPPGMQPPPPPPPPV